MVMSALHIHQAHGTVEMHFSPFVLLALLIFYRDWLPIVVATTVIAHIAGSDVPVNYLSCDYSSETITQLASTLSGPFSHVFICTGVLHNEHIKPEKRIEDIDVAQMAELMHICESGQQQSCPELDLPRQQQTFAACRRKLVAACDHWLVLTTH
jgi:hypothetical protein